MTWSGSDHAPAPPNPGTWLLAVQTAFPFPWPIDDLLDVSRVVSGKMRLDVRLVELRSVIEGALDAVRPAAEAKAIRLQSILDPRAGPITGR